MKPDLLAHKKTRFDHAVFVASKLEHHRLEMERELQPIKWIGYRFMTPLDATRLFYDKYRAARVEYVREHKDVELARKLRTVSFDEFARRPEALAGAWFARQAADTLGVPYNIYVDFGLWFWSRRSGGGRQGVPQITQLGYKESSEVAWRTEFEKYAKDRIALAYRSLADVPQLRASSFEGTSEQVVARDLILDHCQASAASWAHSIETWCYTYPILTPDCFAARVPGDVLRSALDLVDISGTVAMETESASPSLLWPSCHGMPNALDPDHEGCANCAFADSCGQFATMVKAEVLGQAGREEPRRAQLRVSPNKRMRAFRARKKAAAAGAPTDALSLPEKSSPLPELVIS